MTDEPSLTTQLLDSALEGDLASLARLVTFDPTIVDCRDDWGQTPTMLAAIRGHLQIVEWLLDHGADILALDSFGQDALFHASNYPGNATVIRLLLDRGSQVNRTVNGCTALIEASSGGYQENVAALLQNHPDVNHVTDNYETALTFAIVNGTAAVVRQLIEAGANVNWIDNGDCTPLIFAMSERDPEKVRALLQAGADPTYRDMYAFHQAVQANSPDLVRIIAPHCSADQLKAAASKAEEAGLVDMQLLLLDIAERPAATIRLQGKGWGPAKD